MTLVADIAPLLAPISPENPAGENLEYELLFDTIRSARESDPDYLPEGDWSVSEPRKADWNKVRMLSEKALIEQSKDLQLACWLVESRCHLQGLAGLCSGIDFLCAFLQQFWFQCWPSLEEDGVLARRSRLSRLDRDISMQLFRQPLLAQEITSLATWREIQAFEQKITAHPESREELIAQKGDLSMSSFDRLATQFSAHDISQQLALTEQLAAALRQCEACYASLSEDQEGDVFVLIRQTLAEVTDYLQRLAQRAMPLATDAPVDSAEGAPLATTSPFATSQMMNRELAISQMLAIGAWFRQTEPSSPVPFLMDRAARWANMTLTEWLEEMLTDDTSLHAIHNVLTGQTQ